MSHASPIDDDSWDDERRCSVPNEGLRHRGSHGVEGWQWPGWGDGSQELSWVVWAGRGSPTCWLRILQLILRLDAAVEGVGETVRRHNGIATTQKSFRGFRMC